MATANLGELVFKITGDNSGLKRSLNDTEKATSKTASTFKKVGLAALGFFAADRIFAFGKAVVKAASDAEETANKFGAVFSDITSSAIETANAVAAAYNISNTEAKEFISTTGNVLTSLGYTQEAALGLSASLTALASD